MVNNPDSEKNDKNNNDNIRNKKPEIPVKNQSPFVAYVIVSQITIIVLLPLLLFIWGGSWLVREFSLPGQMMVVFVLLGVVIMIGTLASYLYKLIKYYDTDKRDKYQNLKYDRKDYDFYDENRKK